MFPFPFSQMTWRESVVGFTPTEMVYMQVEHNWVTFNPAGMGFNGNGQALGRNLGSVKWRMSEEILDGRSCRKLHSESHELKTENVQMEDLWVEPSTNTILRQDEWRIGEKGTERAESVFYPDRVETRRVGFDGKTVNTTMMPEGGMIAVQRRFAPIDKESKEFLVVDGFLGTFHKVKVEPMGHFTGNWGVEKYAGRTYRFTCDGKEQTAMVTDQGELVKVEFSRDFSLMITTATRSRRRLPQPTHPNGNR